ncbi:hypothetical protein AAAC51_07365 [Priestia megaterium]
MDIVGKAGSITMLIIMWINWYKSDRDSKEAQKKQKHFSLAQQEMFAEELSKATGMKKKNSCFDLIIKIPYGDECNVFVRKCSCTRHHHC